MAFYCQNMLEIALILTEYDAMYEDIAFRFLEHFVWITYAMDRIGDHHDEMWDAAGRVFLRPAAPAKWGRHAAESSLHGGIATVVRIDCTGSNRCPGATSTANGVIELFKKRHPDLLKHIAPADGKFVGYAGRRLLSVCNRQKIERILSLHA